MFEHVRARWRLKSLIRLWMAYHEIVSQVVGMEEIPLSEQKRFLTIKARIATLLQHLEQSLPTEMAGEARQEIADMTNLLKRHISLDNDPAQVTWVRKEFGQIWHEHYIFLHKLMGVRLGGAELQRARPVPATAKMPRRLFRGISPWPHRLRVVAVLVVIAAVGFAMKAIFGVSKIPGGRFAVENESGFGNFLENALNAGNSLAMQLAGFFTPVVDAYGMTWTYVLLGVLVLGFGYWTLARN